MKPTVPSRPQPEACETGGLATLVSFLMATRSRCQRTREALAFVVSRAPQALRAARREIARAPSIAAKAWRLRRADNALRSAINHRDLPQSMDAALVALKNGADPLMLWVAGNPDAPDSLFVAAALYLGQRNPLREHELEAALRASAIASPLLKTRGRSVAARLMTTGSEVSPRFDLQAAAALVRAGCGLLANSGDEVANLLEDLARRTYNAHCSPTSFGEPAHVYDAMAAVLDDQAAQHFLRAENAYAARSLIARLLPAPDDCSARLCAWAGGQRPHRSRAYCWLADELITRFLPLGAAREMMALAATDARGDEPGSATAGTPRAHDTRPMHARLMLPKTSARIEHADLSAEMRLPPIPDRAGQSVAAESQTPSPAAPSRPSRARRL